MKPQPAHSDPLINSSMATAASPGIDTSMKLKKAASNSKVMDHLASIGDSCLKIKIRIDELADSYFSGSEMAAAEQLVQLSDHSDASCNTAVAKDFDADGDDAQGGGEICSSSRSAAKVKIEEIFGSLDDEEEDPDLADNRKWKKYGSLAEIYKRTKPLIDHRKGVTPRPVGTRLAKKVRYC